MGSETFGPGGILPACGAFSFERWPMPSGLSLQRKSRALSNQGVSGGLADLAAQLAAFVDVLPLTASQGVEAAALAVEESVDNHIARAAPSRRLRNVGKSGARVGVRYDMRAGRNPTALVRATGPLHIIERDTRAYVIVPGARRGRKSRAARQAPITFAGVQPLGTPEHPSYRVNHPGTTGKHPFEKGVDAVADDVPQIIMQELRDTMKEIFR